MKKKQKRKRRGKEERDIEIEMKKEKENLEVCLKCTKHDFNLTGHKKCNMHETRANTTLICITQLNETQATN